MKLTIIVSNDTPDVESGMPDGVSGLPAVLPDLFAIAV